MAVAAPPAPERARLSTNRRVALLLFTMVAFAALLGAFAAMVGANLHFFGEQPSARDRALSDQAEAVALWAVVSPLLAWWFLRAPGPVAAAPVALWLVLLAVSRPWWWPPVEESGGLDDPVWWAPAGVPAWLLVGAGLALGVRVAWRDRRRRAVALAVAGVTVGVMVWSGWQLAQAAEREQPTVLGGAAEIVAALEADPFWSAAPPPDERRSAPAERSADGTVSPSTVRGHWAAEPSRPFFLARVADAEANGWLLVSSYCTGEYVSGLLTKGELSLDLYDQRGRVAVSMSDTGVTGLPPERPCW